MALYYTCVCWKGIALAKPSGWSYHKLVESEAKRLSEKRGNRPSDGGLSVLTNLLKYKDYYARITFDSSADSFHGRVIGVQDVIDFIWTILAGSIRTLPVKRMEARIFIPVRMPELHIRTSEKSHADWHSLA